ncbi:hypothetical protein EVAR_81551_1 [Eumeta japonica]|uniref:Uncharacterized protein n=1 Tax=Eumeta variegata TaxID=151549 RepID=A0A4C1UZ98_EUMVA|nr:hypothetical protein EVAR_81551_1 [Eumeta japonica]
MRHKVASIGHLHGGEGSVALAGERDACSSTPSVPHCRTGKPPQPLSTLVTPSFKPHRSLTSLFLDASLRNTAHILRRGRISTAFTTGNYYF